MYSLSKAKISTQNKISPSISPGETNDNTRMKKSLAKRSSSVYSLVQDLKQGSSSDDGTSLFIAATLLQREMIETLVPLQASMVMYLLYSSGVRSNSLVSSWTSDDDFHRALMYLGIDLGVEIVVFVSTIFVLGRIYPEFSAWRILMGLIRVQSLGFFVIIIEVWMVVLFFQNTIWGLDLTFKFEWLDCDGENATWVGGFDWDNC